MFCKSSHCAESVRTRRLSLYFKSFLASRADHGVLSLGAGQSKHSAAMGTLAIHVSLSVVEFVASELEESAESFVFPTALDKVSGKHAEEDHENQQEGYQGIAEHQDGAEPCVGDKQRPYRIHKNQNKVTTEKDLIQGIRAVPSVQESV